MAESPDSAAASEPLVCERVGEPMPDIAGIGIILGFSVQALISLGLSMWVMLLQKHGRLGVTQHEEGTREHQVQSKRLELISSMLMIGNDIQLLTGQALMITAFALARELDLYHMHLIYDTISLVGVSSCAALLVWQFTAAFHVPSDYKWRSQDPRNKNQRMSRFSPRHRMIYMFAALFLALTIMLETQLKGWDLNSEELGRCYITTGIATSSDREPLASQIYVAVTAAWSLFCLFGVVVFGHRKPKLLLILSLLQFPVHLYFMLSLRIHNTGALEGAFSEGGESEDRWDFGQTTATLLLGITLHEVITKGIEYVQVGRKGIEAVSDYDDAQGRGLLGPVVELGLKKWRGGHLKKSMTKDSDDNQRESNEEHEERSSLSRHIGSGEQQTREGWLELETREDADREREEIRREN